MKLYGLNKNEVLIYSENYQYKKPDPNYENAEFLTKKRFLEIAQWKSMRPNRYYENNDAAWIKEITKAAFAPNASDAFRIEALTLLKGVSYPVASALLHFGYKSTYPIIDFRALWSLWRINRGEIKYTTELWLKYIETCRKLASTHKPKSAGIRELDKALWQFSKERQPKG